ncbi:GTPase HflX [Herpetosiphon giganteus]|uniref:GTPase HflX n=1 Tax=Herpetosiphon giganteus TaxID=2029754 RepID=UPI00195CEE3B|nr:GTPase HflX [Herpetosiphon giganteus]MBM7845226.1 GTP-binding protein HflX [Herpetosiphon giganteus]
MSNTVREKMHVTAKPKERALLVGGDVYNNREAWHIDDSLDELALLADTAGLEVVGTVSQKLDHPNPKTYIGPGKVREVADLRSETPYDVVIFDEELSPSQARNLEEAIKVKVIDRTTLILDIFAQHARTREGSLQVELAQYDYLLPRLRRAWTHLERQSGGGGGGSGVGVGLRGPGETQLESDQRIIGKRIALLKEQLADVHRHRELYRQNRQESGLPIISVVGYTNAGKSTLLNRLAQADVLAADMLFATLDPTTRKVALPGGRAVLMTDTVGFIQRLPTALVAAFRATLEEIAEADVLLHVLDLTHANVEEQFKTVMDTLSELKVQDKPILTVFNKIDKIDVPSDTEIVRMITELGLPIDRWVAISAQQNIGIDRLQAAIEQMLMERMVKFEVMIPYKANELVALWHERGMIESEEFGEEGTTLKGAVPRQFAHRYEQYRLK